VFLLIRADAAMERERLLALEKERQKEEAKLRYVNIYYFQNIVLAAPC